VDPALVVVLAGISAALHVGKLAPALPVLRESLHISLVQAGFLLSMVQLAGMTLGLAMGRGRRLAGRAAHHGAGPADPRRGELRRRLPARTPEALMALRAAEGAGFLLASLPAPGLIRRLVEPARLSAALGLCGAVHAFRHRSGAAAGAGLHRADRLAGWWWLLALVSLAMAAVVLVAVPASADVRHAGAAGAGRRIAAPSGPGGRGWRRWPSPCIPRSGSPWWASCRRSTRRRAWPRRMRPSPRPRRRGEHGGQHRVGRLLQRGVPAPVLMHCG
jgi:hypothetical protein